MSELRLRRCPGGVVVSEADTESVECIVCGAHIPDPDKAMWGQGSPNEAAFEDLADGESVSVDDAFEFDDGPYCGLGCLVEGGDE